MGLVFYLGFFEPPAGILSIRPFTLGLDAFVLGWTFLGLPLDSFTPDGLSCAGAP